MYFYYFICSGVWRKKPYLRAIREQMQTATLTTVALILVLHVCLHSTLPFLLLLAPAAYYIYALVRPSVCYVWKKDGKKYFCAVYFDQASVFRKNGILISGCNTRIIRTAKIRRCKKQDTPQTLLVKIADSGRYMLYNAKHTEGLMLGTPLKHINLAQGDSCFIAGRLISFVMNNGEIIRLPNVTVYKMMIFPPEHGRKDLKASDFMTGEAPLPIGHQNPDGSRYMDFGTEFPYIRYLALKQSDGTELLLCIEFTCLFIKQILKIGGSDISEMLKNI